MECKFCGWTQFFTTTVKGEKALQCERCGTVIEQKKTKNKIEIEEVE